MPLRRRSHLPAAAALLALVGGLMDAACYAPSIKDGTLECATGNRCPRGFVCREDVNLCYRPDAAMTDTSPGGERDGAAQETALDVVPAADAAPDGAKDVASGAGGSAAGRGGEGGSVAGRGGAGGGTAGRGGASGGGAGSVSRGGSGGAAGSGGAGGSAAGGGGAGGRGGGGGGPKSNGTPCAQSSECASQRCVDGVCCNEACGEQCKACDVGTSLGICTQVTSGLPHGTRASCGGGSGTCAGFCSSASATACTYPGDATTCRSASCSGTTFTARAGCNGAGSCPAATTSSCGDLACDASGTACLATCTSDNHCVAPTRPYCDGGACVSGRSNGARCQTAGECASQRCVDGFCCNDACQSPCQACDVAGHAGTCSPVSNGTPYGGRAPCGGTSSCAGYCNNLSSGQCFYPGSTQSCACPNGIGSGTCNGMGQCQTLAGLCL